MKKFSKMKSGDKLRAPKEKVIYTNDKNLKVIEFEDWHIIKERDCVCCIPYLIESNQIVLRYEYIPTFKYATGQEYHVTLVAGGIENGEAPNMALLRELEEEAGIVLREDYVLDAMKPLFMSKGSVNKFYPYILPLSERDFTEKIATGDGSKAEKLSKSVRVDVKYIDSINASDLITDYMLMKLKEYMNLNM